MTGPKKYIHRFKHLNSNSALPCKYENNDCRSKQPAAGFHRLHSMAIVEVHHISDVKIVMKLTGTYLVTGGTSNFYNVKKNGLRLRLTGSRFDF